METIQQNLQPIPTPVGGTIENPGTSRGDATQNLQANAEYMCAQLNAKLVAALDARDESYNIMLRSGSFPKLGPPPVGDRSWVVVPADGSPDGMPGYDQVGPPVISTIEILKGNNALVGKQNATPDVTDIGIEFSPGWFNVGPTDSRPNGFEVTLPGPKGNIITLRKMIVPWGGKYEQVA